MTFMENFWMIPVIRHNTSASQFYAYRRLREFVVAVRCSADWRSCGDGLTPRNFPPKSYEINAMLMAGHALRAATDRVFGASTPNLNERRALKNSA